MLIVNVKMTMLVPLCSNSNVFEKKGVAAAAQGVVSTHHITVFLVNLERDSLRPCNCYTPMNGERDLKKSVCGSLTLTRVYVRLFVKRIE